MNRPLHIWSIFAACALVLLGAVTWVTATALRLEKAQTEAQRAAEFEEKVRLALWRMDSLLTPIIVEESARPGAHYKAFTSAGAVPVKGGTFMSDTIVPSPLLNHLPSHALFYFEVTPDGAVSSPEVLPGKYRTLLAAHVTTQHLEKASARLEEMKRLLSEPTVGTALAVGGVTFDNRMVLSNAAAASATNSFPLIFTNTLLVANQQLEQLPIQPQSFNVTPAEIRRQQQQVQGQRNSDEFQARANIYQQVAQAGINAAIGNNQAAPLERPLLMPGVEVAQAGTNAAFGTNQAALTRPERPLLMPNVLNAESPMTPAWLGPALVLARRANAPQGPTIQGVWLNWDGLKQRLVENIRDLFPNADLRAAPAADGHSGRRLAALPAEFVPGAISRSDSLLWTSARLTLALAWGCMLFAVLAVAALLHGAVSLSERRGAFVSAVTHELRTPLTTFKMYSEMLAEGMVTEETKRQQYLQTLRSEANRLSHLVENVLAYARLERGSARTRVERMTLGELIERTLPRLRERTERCEMKLVIDAQESVLATVVHVDAAAVEQILFNLVDNACKYAAPQATEKVIHLEALPDGRFAMLRVRDHGAGISAEGARRLFKPFSKSAQEAAHTAPGIGLGLALCRRLSRSLGGELRLVPGMGEGACFELRLPLGGTAH